MCLQWIFIGLMHHKNIIIIIIINLFLKSYWPQTFISYVYNTIN